jgi:hypothetical protein
MSGGLSPMNGAFHILLVFEKLTGKSQDLLPLYKIRYFCGHIQARLCPFLPVAELGASAKPWTNLDKPSAALFRSAGHTILRPIS